MLPIRDENPTSKSPHITRLIIIVNVIIFFVIWFEFYSSLEEAIWEYGMIPAYIVVGQRLHTLLTSMFMHGGIIHLAGNMLYIHIFGDNVEDAFGHGQYLIFYFLCGIVASITHLLSITTVEAMFIPAVGASGAISGVLGAYLILYPRTRILTLMLYGWIYIRRIPSIFFIGFWFIFQLFAGALTLASEVSSGVAYWAHIGGFVAGMAFASILRIGRTPHVEARVLSE